MNSSNDIDAFDNQIKVGLGSSGGGEYRIVISLTGEIVKSG
jgi:hypothetical protein